MPIRHQQVRTLGQQVKTVDLHVQRLRKNVRRYAEKDGGNPFLRNMESVIGRVNAQVGRLIRLIEKQQQLELPLRRSVKLRRLR